MNSPLTCLRRSVLFAADPAAGTPSAWTQLINISFDGWAIHVKIGPIVYVLAFLAVIAILLLKRQALSALLRRFEVVEAEASVFGLPRFTVRANHENVRIAYEAWIELVTRKAGLPFDEEHDTIVEIYNSWH